MPIGQRQQSQRTVGKKTLPRGALMRALGAHMRHHRALRVIAAARVDAGQLAQRRSGAVGGDQQARGDGLAIGQIELDAILLRLEAEGRS